MSALAPAAVAPSIAAAAAASGNSVPSSLQLSTVRSALPPVSQSCMRLAALRAEESARDHPLVRDPFASALAGHRAPAKAHFVFRQANQAKIKQAAAEAAAAAAASATGTEEGTVTPVAAENADAIAAPSAGDSAPSSAAAPASPSLSALRSTLHSRASALNMDRALAPDTMIRTRFMDDVIAAECSGGDDGVRQLVLLGAGLDSRAYRLPCLDRTAVFELDVAGVLEYKASVFASLATSTAAAAATVADSAQAAAAASSSAESTPPASTPAPVLMCRSLVRVPADFSQSGVTVRVSKTSQKAAKKRKGAPGADPSSYPSSTSSSAASSSVASAGNADAPLSAATAAAVSSGGADGPVPPPWLSGLLSAGFDPSLRTLWCAEGLLMYLDRHQVANMLSWISTVANRPSSSPPSTGTRPRHVLVADIMNENMVKSKLKWFRYFRWGCARQVEKEGSAAAATSASGAAAMEEEELHERGSAVATPSPIELFMRAQGWRISPRLVGESCEGYEPASAAAIAASACSPDLAASPVVEPPPVSPLLHIHPIGRAGLSYGRYLQPPLLDDTSFPTKPPMMLETYIIKAHVQQQ